MAMMSSANVKATPKVKAEVEVMTHDGVVLKGKFFTVPSQRVLDVLNDERTFLPFETEDGDIYIINKTFVTRIRPLGKPVASAREAPDLAGTVKGSCTHPTFARPTWRQLRGTRLAKIQRETIA